MKYEREYPELRVSNGELLYEMIQFLLVLLLITHDKIMLRYDIALIFQYFVEARPRKNSIYNWYLNCFHSWYIYAWNDSETCTLQFMEWVNYTHTHTHINLHIMESSWNTHTRNLTSQGKAIHLDTCYFDSYSRSTHPGKTIIDFSNTLHNNLTASSFM